MLASPLALASCQIADAGLLCQSGECEYVLSDGVERADASRSFAAAYDGGTRWFLAIYSATSHALQIAATSSNTIPGNHIGRNLRSAKRPLSPSCRLSSHITPSTMLPPLYLASCV
jgi:hypothetical protein